MWKAVGEDIRSTPRGASRAFHPRTDKVVPHPSLSGGSLEHFYQTDPIVNGTRPPSDSRTHELVNSSCQGPRAIIPVQYANAGFAWKCRIME